MSRSEPIRLPFSKALTFPLLILGLYLALLTVSIVLGSWAGHSHPASDDARRVTDAAERAALGQLIGPAKLSLGAVAILSAASGLFAYRTGASPLLSAASTALAPILLAVAVFYSCRRILRAAGQLVASDTRDERVTTTSRTLVGAVLCCDAAIGICLLSLHSLAAMELGVLRANQLVLLASSSIAMVCAIFARSTTSSILVAVNGAREAGPEPHAGSLALLVSKSFHTPLLRILSVVSISALGHAALLVMTTTGSEQEAASWLYPHLLKLLGLFCLLFSGLVVRSSEHERSTSAWLRGAIVHLVLMIAGTWTLSSELSEAWSKSVPAGLTFLYFALVVSISIPFGGASFGTSPPPRTNLRRAPGIAVYLLLLLILILATRNADGPDAIATLAFSSLLLSATFALAPLATVWLLSRDLSVSGGGVRSLAYGGNSLSPSHDVGAPNAFLGMLALLILPAGLGALVAQSGNSPDGALDTLFLGLGAATGALCVGCFLAQTNKLSEARVEVLHKLLHHPINAGAIQLNFENAVNMCREAVETGGILTTSILIAPVALVVVMAQVAVLGGVGDFCLGLSLSGIISSVGFEVLSGHDARLPRQAFASLGLVSGLALSLWMLTLSTLLT